MSSGNDTTRSVSRIGRISLTVCLLLFLILTVNVLLGKAKLIFDLERVRVLSDTAEYLLLLGTALFFAIAALMKERETAEGEGRRSLNDD